MTPASAPQEIAALLATKAPGERVVHLSGFAGDVTAYDSVKAKAVDPQVSAAAPAHAASELDALPSSATPAKTETLPVGVATVHARVKESMTDLRDAGAKVDAVTVEVPSTLSPGPATDAVLARAVDEAVKEIYPAARVPERAVPASEGGVASSEGEPELAQASAPASQDPATTETHRLTKQAIDDARAALAAQGQRRLPEWDGTLQYRGVDWDRIFTLARDNPEMRSVLFGMVQYADQIVATDPSRYRRPATLGEIAPDMVDPVSLNAGPNREARALAMVDCFQADFLRSKGLTLAIAARYGNNPAHLAKILEILGEVADWGPFQRPGWSLGDPTYTMPEGGDGVNMATGWGVNGVVDILHVLGDRVPADLRQRLIVSLRREVAAIADSWAHRRPWFVKSGTANCNQWIDPSAALMKACMFIGDPALMDPYTLGAENIAWSLSLSGEDGAFLEGMAYAQMSLAPVFDTLIAARAAGDARFTNLPFAERSWKWFAHMLMPGGMLVNCYDSRMPSLPNWAMRSPLDSMALAAVISGDPVALRTVQSLFPDPSHSMSGLRFLAALAEANGAPPSEPIQPWASFPSQQLVTWREAMRGPSNPLPEMALWVKGSSLKERSHGHRDQGQVTVQFGGRMILMDCGTPDYSSPDYSTKYAGAAGHGIMQVGEIRPHQQAVDAPAEVVALGPTGGQVRVNSSAAYAAGTQCTRDVTWSAQGRVTLADSVVLPSLVAAGTEIYRLHTGSSEPLSISGSGANWTVSWHGTQMSLQASGPIVVEQVQWPDAVRAPFVHQALIIRSADATDRLNLTTTIDIDRSVTQ